MLNLYFLFYIYFLCYIFTTLLYVSSSLPFHNASLFHSCHDHEGDALLSFKETFTCEDYGGDYPYFKNCGDFSKWKKGTDCCKWEGVKCDPLTHHVIRLSLSSSNIKAPITSNSSLFNLRYLESLDLSYNHFYSTISSKFGQFHFLKHLYLSDNSFSGEVPLEISQLSQLRSFALSYNVDLKMPNFNRIIGNMSNLRVLSLRYVKLDSEIPQFITNFSSLSTIGLDECNLHGKLPTNILNLPNLKQLSILSNYGVTFCFASSQNLSRSLELINLAGVNISSKLPELPRPFPKLTSFIAGGCSLHGKVPAWVWNVSESIGLAYNNLSGSINLYNILNHLPHLTFLSLVESGLSVSLKESPLNYNSTLANSLTNLHLGSTNINDKFPTWFQGIGLHSLVALDLSNNALTGNLESIPWNRLRYFNISYNMLQGRLPIPSSTTPLHTFFASNNNFSGPLNSTLCEILIIYLDLSYNNLNGELPHCIGNIQNPEVLILGSNNFNGTLPPKFYDWGSLKYLDFSNNSLQGLLPKSLEQCKSIVVLNLARNNLTGEYPKWLHTLPQLAVLDLSSNTFHGHICDIDERNPFSKLQILDLSNNNFSGKIPSAFIKTFRAMMNFSMTIGMPQYYNIYILNNYYYSIHLTFKGVETNIAKIITSLCYIDLSSNAFQGNIPDCIGELVSIHGLNLSHNHLSGPIPASIGKLLALESLDLSFNMLKGYIPQELVSLTGLAVFNVSENHLQGQIPQGKNFGTFLANSYEGNPGLCGQPLPKCGGDHEPFEHQTNNHEDGNGSLLLEWEIVLMGFGSGVIIGLAWGYYMFSVGKPFWFIKLANKMEMVLLRD